MNHTTRLVIDNKDIMRITGKSRATATRLMRKVRKQFNRRPGSMITLQDFCTYMGLPEEKVIQLL
ncbi:MAG TPA: hypothetical protein VK489_03810 [Ferruginibacter sp.]|nr:hypothetical protein [Ferruginibacter sp.]